MDTAPSRLSSSLPRTTYVLLAGLPGTGKSTLAAALVKRVQSAVVLNKDDVRAALFPGDATDYADAQNDLCMEAMLSAASYLCGRFSYIFFDGRTFSRASHIERITHAAGQAGAVWRILHLWCADEVALARIAASQSIHPAGNRNAKLYQSLRLAFEPIQQPHLSLDTGRPLDLCMEESLLYLSR
jgi:predicted kinase